MTGRQPPNLPVDGPFAVGAPTRKQIIRQKILVERPVKSCRTLQSVDRIADAERAFAREIKKWFAPCQVAKPQKPFLCAVPQDNRVVAIQFSNTALTKSVNNVKHQLFVGHRARQ